MAMLRSYGLQVRSSHYSVYLSKPRSIEVTMTAPTQHALATIEDNGFPWQQDTQNIVVGYNAYSPSGDVTAPVVYANYGRPEDFAALEQLGVDVHGKIVLVRYGKKLSATVKLGEVARAEGNAPVAQLAEHLALHAKSEEELFYPAAVLVGDAVRARSKANTGQ